MSEHLGTKKVRASSSCWACPQQLPFAKRQRNYSWILWEALSTLQEFGTTLKHFLSCLFLHFKITQRMAFGCSPMKMRIDLAVAAWAISREAPGWFSLIIVFILFAPGELAKCGILLGLTFRLPPPHQIIICGFRQLGGQHAMHFFTIWMAVRPGQHPIVPKL